MIDRSPLHLLHRAKQAVELLFVQSAAGIDLTPRQLLILMMVADHEGLSQTDLTEHTGVDRSTMADVVRRLKSKGWIQRRRTREDARLCRASNRRRLASVACCSPSSCWGRPERA
jgi:MarR family transcriptional regulator, temperature-dependent positive regulator of motility